ncbi:MAG: class I SAM-dependent methyltransferase [Bacteroidota bacterium]
MSIYATEITSDTEPSDNPIHQRLLKAYVIARDVVHGDLLEVGCGEGRGIGLLIDRVTSFTAIDKIDEALAGLRKQWPQGTFISGNIPPFGGLPDNAFDTVISFQVIEHIQDDTAFLREIHRVLKPGGKAWLTTPNRPMSLTRNPWHIREYTGPELLKLAASIFSKAEMKGIGGNEKVMAYHEENRQSVRRFTRWDIFNLQYRLPASLLRIPYEILNRLNRKNLKQGNEHLVSGITHEDYPVMDTSAGALDLLLMVEK